MAEKKVVVVFGATGTQGGSVVRALKDSPTFRVRAVTRNPDSDSAKALKGPGVEVVKGDQDDPASLEALFDGAYATFLVTNFWAHLDKAREIKQGINAVEAAKKQGVQHIVFSSLPDTSAIKPLEHFMAKVEIEKHLKESGVPYTVVQYSAFMENLFTFFRPQKIADNTYGLNWPIEDKPIMMIPASQCGICIRTILENKEQYLGKVFGFSSDRLTAVEMASILSSKLAPAKFVPGEVTLAEFAPKSVSPDLVDMFEVIQKGGYGNPDVDITSTRQLYPGIPDFKAFVDQNLESLKQL